MANAKTEKVAIINGGEVAPTTAQATTPAQTGAVAPTMAETIQSSNNKRTMASPQGASVVKKRPYRRTKRPKDYCDKSTVTTTTPTLENHPVNVYDAVLGECEDLLKASLEAQRLGRLKMASAYQLLLHTRLVGLGKRFDRASVISPVGRHRAHCDDDDYDDEYDDDQSEDESRATPATNGGGLVLDSNPTESAQALAASSLAALSDAASTAAPAATPTPPSGSADQPTSTSSGTVTALPQALEKLTAILPSNFEMDTSMMEHLARAAVELHHQRTGRKKSADGLLASPMTGLIGSPNPSGDENCTNGKDNTKIAWTAEEQKIVEKAASEKKAPYAIAKLLKNKTEAQVKAFLKNQAKSSEQTDTLADDLGSPSKKRGGRGRKPPTTAMNTVPNANLDAKSLLLGILK